MCTAGLITIWVLLFFKVFLKKYFRKVFVSALTFTPSRVLQQNIVSLSNIGILILYFLRTWLIAISMKFFFVVFWDFSSHYLFSKLWVTGPYYSLLCYNLVPWEIWLHFTSDSVKLAAADVPAWRQRYQWSSEEDTFPKALEITYLSTEIKGMGSDIIWNLSQNLQTTMEQLKKGGLEFLKNFFVSVHKQNSSS